MKRKMLLIPCFLIGAGLISSSCIGSFGLLNKFSGWNQSATGNKYVNGFIGILLSPVYSLCFTVDWFVLNTIEFWTGNQLIAANTTQRMVGTNGEVYLVQYSEKGIQITNETKNDSMLLTYDQENSIWSCEYDGKVSKLLRVNKDETLTVFTPNGEEVTVENNEKGLKDLEAQLLFSPVTAE